MHNCYISSTITIRSKGYLSFSFNDNCCLLNERIGKSSCSSCDCCAFSIHRLPINPSFLYGLRQSTLIHWSASRMLILGGGDRNCWLPDLDRGCYGVSGSLRGRSISKRRIRGREGRFGCMVSEENGERYDSGVDGSAEAMLSLLTEEIGENCVGNGRLASRRARVEKRGHITDGCSGEEKENVGPNYLEMNSKSEFELVKIKAKEEGYMWSGGKEGSSRRENFGVRKEGSSCSSYYSVSYSGDIESDALVQAKHGVFPGESSSGYKKESKKNREKAFVEKVTEQFKSYGDDVGGNSEVSIQGNVAVGSYAMGSVEWNSRNTTEKNFTEVSSGQKISREESPQKHSKISKIWGSGTERVSSSHSKFNGKEENSTLAVNLVEETRDQRSQTGDRVTEHSESLRKTQQLTEMSEIQDSDFEMISSSQKQLSDMKGNITAAVNSVQETRDRNSQMVDQITGQNISRRKFQQLTKTSEFNDNDTQKNSISQRQTETEMEKIDDHSTSILSSAQVTREQSTQRGHQIIREIDSRGKSQPLGGMSEIHGSDIEKTPTSQKRSVTRMKNQDKSSTSVQEAKELCTATNQEVLGRSELRKESQDRINVSVIRACDTERVTDSQRLSEERITSQEENFTSVVDLIEETRERRNQSGGILYEQIGSREESRRPIKTSSFLENTSERASSSQKSLNSVRQAREQQIGARKEDETNSQVILMPPPSQLVARVSLDVEPTSGYTTKEFYSETSEIGSSALYTHPQGRRPALPNEQHDGTRKDETYEEPSNLIVHEDAFGSAHLIEKSSTQFVREFVEKSRHEGSTSEIQKERKSYEKQQGLSQYVFENLPISDEMLGVADLSFHEPPTTEAPECSPKTRGVTVKRTSRSLWNIIADVVRMRWGARAESHSSAVKSGGRSLSNELVGSEAWFSSHESDKNNDENVKRGRRSMPKEPRSTNQTQLGKAPTQSQGEVSDTMSSQDKLRQGEANISSPGDTLDISSASKGTSSASGRENFDWNEDEKRGQGISSSITSGDSSLPLPDRRLSRSPVIEQTSESSKVEVSRSGFMDQLEQPVRERPTEASGTEGKDGDLKRRKLQRNKQVQKERFDQWEEAYKLESEQRKIDEMFMMEALLEAKKAANTWEVPVGAVLVHHGKVIARGCNLVEELRDSTAHAEMICIREASNLLRTWRLAETTLYVTLEPCPMCAGAILQSRIDSLVWGAPNKLLGADGSWVRLFPSGIEGGSGSDQTNQPAGPVHPFHPNMKIRRGVLATECAEVMQQFFQLRRRKKEKKPEPPTPPSCLPVSTHPSKFISKMHNIFSIMFCL